MPERVYLHFATFKGPRHPRPSPSFSSRPLLGGKRGTPQLAARGAVRETTVQALGLEALDSLLARYG